MQKKFLFAVGDASGARMLVPVVNNLIAFGDCAEVLADADGIAYQVLSSEKVAYTICPSEIHNLDQKIQESSVVVVNTCASAIGVGKKVAEEARGKRPLVFSADGFYNHGYRWQSESADYWLAINEAHASAIRNSKHLPENQVIVTGQPAFDSCLHLIPHKGWIRNEMRRRLGISEALMVVWFSQGMPEVISEDVWMVERAIQALGELAPGSFFLPRIHPKLDKIRQGLVNEIQSAIQRKCEESCVRLVTSNGIPAEHICLAADAILSITATDDIKNWIMGGPPVIHILSPEVQKWFETDVKLTRPYLLELESGEALVVYEPEDWPQAFAQAFDPGTVANLRKSWTPPAGPSAMNFIKTLYEVSV